MTTILDGRQRLTEPRPADRTDTPGRDDGTTAMTSTHNAAVSAAAPTPQRRP